MRESPKWAPVRFVRTRRAKLQALLALLGWLPFTDLFVILSSSCAIAMSTSPPSFDVNESGSSHESQIMSNASSPDHENDENINPGGSDVSQGQGLVVIADDVIIVEPEPEFEDDDAEDDAEDDSGEDGEDEDYDGNQSDDEAEDDDDGEEDEEESEDEEVDYIPLSPFPPNLPPVAPEVVYPVNPAFAPGYIQEGVAALPQEQAAGAPPEEQNPPENIVEPGPPPYPEQPPQPSPEEMVQNLVVQTMNSGPLPQIPIADRYIAIPHAAQVPPPYPSPPIQYNKADVPTKKHKPGNNPNTCEPT
uniref:Extensin-like n=1 Tax=Panagrellus redivivus TaxID=6233 RepID=A0A7E4VZB2_PANRE